MLTEFINAEMLGIIMNTVVHSGASKLMEVQYSIGFLEISRTDIIVGNVQEGYYLTFLTSGGASNGICKTKALITMAIQLVLSND